MWFLIPVHFSGHVSTSVERVIAEKLTGFQLTKKYLYGTEPELSLPYIIMKNRIEILTSLTVIIRTFNSVFVLLVWNFLCDSPLNLCTCLTNVYML
jgi:hypothetical protein